MKTFLKSTSLTLCLLGASFPAFAQTAEQPTAAQPTASQVQPAAAQSNTMRIVAIVNEDIITIHDVAARIRFILYSTGNSNPDAATLKRVQNQALRGLIDERLKRQAAEENSISVSDGEIQRELRKLEQRNKLPLGGIDNAFLANNLDIQTLKDQIYANIIWVKYVARVLRRQVRIGEEQVDDELNLISSQLDKKQKRVFEIFLPLESIEQESDARANMQEILKNYRDGIEFTQLARLNSKANSAQLGGDRGWLSPGQLPANLDEVVQKLQPGQISEPLETLTGLYLFYVSEERSLGGDKGKTELSFLQLSYPTSEAGAETTLRQLGEEFNSCGSAEDFANNNPSISIQRTDKINLEDLSDSLQKALGSLKIGATSAPIELGDNMSIFTICNRIEPKSHLPSRSQIRQKLLADKLDIVALQHLRDLRNNAFIDIRGM